MKTKTLVILLVILGLLGGGGYLLVRLKSPDRETKILGTRLLGDLPANRIAVAVMQGPNGSVTLLKKSKGWVVENRFGYPADFSRIREFVRNLKELKIGRAFEPTEETLKRLCLKDPDDPQAQDKDRGTRVLFKDEKDTILASILLGKTRKAGEEGSYADGQYVRLGQEPRVYLVDRHLSSFQADPSAWLDKRLTKVAAEEVKKIACLEADGKATVYVFERPEKGKEFEALDKNLQQKIKRAALNRLAGALSSLRMEDVLDPSEDVSSFRLDSSPRVEYRLFDGTIYRVHPGKGCAEAGPCVLKLEVDYEKPASEEKEASKDKSQEKEEAKPERGPEEKALEAKREDERLSGWTYKVPKWQHSTFVTDLGELLEDPEKKPEKKSSQEKPKTK